MKGGERSAVQESSNRMRASSARTKQAANYLHAPPGIKASAQHNRFLARRLVFTVLTLSTALLLAASPGSVATAATRLKAAASTGHSGGPQPVYSSLSSFAGVSRTPAITASPMAVHPNTASASSYASASGPESPFRLRAESARLKMAATADRSSMNQGKDQIASGQVSATGTGGLHTPRFGTSGLWITDSQGRRLLLRGVDVSGDEYTATNQPLPYDQASFSAIRATGATVVRIPIAWANIEPEPGRYDTAALERVRTILGWAGKAGLLVVLDMHQYDWSPCFGGNGMPAWAVPGCLHSNAGAAAVGEAAPAETAFWESHSLQDAFSAMWTKVATFVGTPKWLLGYDILNEPPAGLIPPEVFESTVLPAFYRLVGSALRRVDPGSLLFVEPAWLHSAVTEASFFLGPIGLTRLVYAPHEYGTSLNDASGNVAELAGPKQFAPDLAATRLQAQRLGAAWWIGEWGDVNTSTDVSVNVNQYVPDMIAAQNAAMVGSAYWTYTTGSWPYTSEIHEQLTYVSPFAIAGVPRSFSSTSDTLELSWTAARGTTIVSLPGGVIATVRALEGSVSWHQTPGGWLDLEARPGTTPSVEITIHPAKETAYPPRR